MATMAAILRALRLEIAARFLDLVPQKFGSMRFREYGEAELAAKPLEQSVLKMRLFAFGDWEIKKLTYHGIGYVGQDMELQIKIAYPLDPEYAIAAMDDFQEIRQDLLNNKTSVTGVAMRLVDVKEFPKFERVGEDAWQLMTFRVTAAVEAS